MWAHIIYFGILYTYTHRNTYALIFLFIHLHLSYMYVRIRSIANTRNFCFQLKLYLTDLFPSYIFTPQQLWRAFSRQCAPDYLPATATTGTNIDSQPLSACGRLKLALTFHLFTFFFLFCSLLSMALASWHAGKLAMPLEAVECTFPTAVLPSLFNAYKYKHKYV